jgi:hypothetical protein
MVDTLREMAEAVIARSQRLFDQTHTPAWARDIIARLTRIERLVRLDMAFDTQVVARLVAAAGALADQSKRVAAERDAYKLAAEQSGADLATVQQTLASERAAEADEDQAEAAATADINAAADAVLGLVNGPSTPDVTPVPIEEVPAVVDGSQPVEDDNGDAIVADGPVDTEAPPVNDPSA